MTVKNMNNTDVDFDAAVNLMDDEIREEIAMEGYATEQEFFHAYEIAHALKYGEEWELSKKNPVW